MRTVTLTTRILFLFLLKLTESQRLYSCFGIRSYCRVWFRSLGWWTHIFITGGIHFAGQPASHHVSSTSPLPVACSSSNTFTGSCTVYEPQLIHNRGRTTYVSPIPQAGTIRLSAVHSVVHVVAHLTVLLVFSNSSLVFVSLRWSSCARCRLLYLRTASQLLKSRPRRRAYPTTLRICSRSSCHQRMAVQQGSWPIAG